MSTDMAHEYIWSTFNVVRNHIEVVECFSTLDALLEAMAESSWEQPDNKWGSFAALGEEVVAVAIFGPDLELMVTTADGRRMSFEMPESYRELAP